MARKAPHKIRSMQAFSLIEAAIVLGVIGLVIGGIWVAASAVTSARRIDQAVTGLRLMVDQFGSLYKPMGFMSIPNGPGVFSTSMLGQVPAGFVVRSDGSLVDPWGNTMDAIRTYRQDDLLATVGFTFYNISKADCLQLINKLNSATNIYTVTSSSGSTYNMPLPFNTAATFACSASTQSVGFGFHLFK